MSTSSHFYGTIIDIRYFLNLNFDASGLAVSKNLSIPIVIGNGCILFCLLIKAFFLNILFKGNIPLRVDASVPNYVQPMPVPSAPFNPYTDINIPPPSYQECLFDPNSNADEKKEFVNSFLLVN